MTALAALGLIGIAVALIRGGSFAGWARIHISWSLIALVSLGIQLILHNPPVDHQAWAMAVGPFVWIGCLAALMAVLARNAFTSKSSRYPWLLAAFGVGLNLLVVVANGGYMPQSPDARETTRGGSLAVAQSADAKLRNIVTMTDQTRLSLLGDVIPEPAWFPNSNVLSAGDLLLGSGLAWWAFLITASTTRRVVR
jgi:Family of unknown function (DUF5317)